MKKVILAALAVGVLLALSACSAADKPKETAGQTTETTQNAGNSMIQESQTAAGGAKEEAYHKITAEEAKKMMDEGGVIVVDVRRADEYAEKHIPGAVLVPNEDIGEEQPELLPDKDAVLLVHCRTGIRSKQASDKLVELGYTNVYDFGGIADWPYETESGAFEQ